MVMADCSETLHELYHYLDGELTADDRIHIEQHLNDCSPCFEAFDFEAELRAVIRRRCTEPVPDRLRQKIAEAINWTDAGPPPARAG
jgi:mycothiol system anti-sigma-R factor